MKAKLINLLIFSIAFYFLNEGLNVVLQFTSEANLKFMLLSSFLSFMFMSRHHLFLAFSRNSNVPILNNYSYRREMEGNLLLSHHHIPQTLDNEGKLSN